MPAWQRRMSMDQVDPVQSLQVANTTDHPCEKKRSGSRKSETSGQREIAKPFRLHAGFPRVKSPPIERLHCEDGVHHSNLRERCERFGDKATGRIVLPARIEGCQRQNVKRSAVLPCGLAPRLPEN